MLQEIGERLRSRRAPGRLGRPTGRRRVRRARPGRAGRRRARDRRSAAGRDPSSRSLLGPGADRPFERVDRDRLRRSGRLGRVAAARRRHRHVHRQEQRQGPLGGLPARHAPAGARALRAPRRPDARARSATSSSCTTSRSSRSTPGAVHGVEALVRWQHPDDGPDRSGPVHRARRGDRSDHPDRAVDPAARRAPRRRASIRARTGRTSPSTSAPSSCARRGSPTT